MPHWFRHAVDLSVRNDGKQGGSQGGERGANLGDKGQGGASLDGVKGRGGGHSGGKDARRQG